MKMKAFGLTETKLFHFHMIFKNRGKGVGLPLISSGSSLFVKVSVYMYPE